VTWRTHVMGGIAALWLLPIALAASTSSVPLAVAFAALGSLLPDLDARESKLSNVQALGIAPLKPAARLLNRSLGHRGAMHSLLAFLLVSILAGLPLGLLLDPLAGLGLSLGYLSHLLLDGITKSGVPLLWPEPGRVKLLPRKLLVTTGSSAEDALFLLLCFVATGFLLLQLFQLQITPPSLTSTYEYSTPTTP
jgi:inner membrane protein